MANQFGMNSVRVKREAILERIKENRDKHRAQFEEALEDYRKGVLKELEEWLERARRGEKVRRATVLTEPQDHTDDYNQIIDMLEMSVDDEIELTHQEFAQYVRDRWSWQGQFGTTMASNKAYLES